MVPRPIRLRPDPDALDELAMSSLVRACITVVHDKLNPGTNVRQFLASRWGSEEARNVDVMMKAATTPAMTTGATWAQPFATVTTAFLSNLVGYSAGADLLARALGLQFNGAVTINVPSLIVPMADFVREGAPIPVIDATTKNDGVLEPYKFAVITTLTREVVEGGNAEPLVRTALLQSTGPALDRRLFDNQPAVVGLRPAGLLYGITPLTPAAAGGNRDDQMKTDLQALLSAVAPVAGNSPIVLVCSAAQAVAINLRTIGNFSYMVLTSSALAAGTVIAVAANALVSVVGDNPSIDTTRAASLHMDDAPLPIASGGAMASRTIGTFQSDVLGLRLRWPVTWMLRDVRGIALLQNVNW